MGARLPVDDEEGQHLVERVGQLGIEAARIDCVDGKAPPGPVERAGLVAEAVMPLGIVARHEMRDRAGARRDQIGLRRAVLQERLRLTLAAPGDTEGRERDFGDEAASRERDLAVGLADIRLRAGETGEVIARAALIGRLEPARRDRPAAVEPVAVLRLQGDPADIAFEDADSDRRAEADIEQGGFTVAAEITTLRQGFHGISLVSLQDRTARPFSSNRCRCCCGKASATAEPR